MKLILQPKLLRLQEEQDITYISFGAEEEAVFEKSIEVSASFC